MELHRYLEEETRSKYNFPHMVDAPIRMGKYTFDDFMMDAQRTGQWFLNM